MFVPAAKFGLHGYPGGLAQARRLFLRACTIDAEDMLRISFLTGPVSPRDLQARADVYRQAIEACGALAGQSMKRQLNALAANCSEDALARDDFERSLRLETLRQRLA